MGFAFNPFTGNFDAKGSGGGGASYIDGEVQNFSALPETLGTPAVDSAYLVREAEGTWLLNRKPAGIYIRTANTGTRASDWTYAGEFPDVFSDANFVLYDNGDSTKNLQFQLSGISTGTTRTLTAPDASGTIARTEDFAAPPAIGNTTPNAGTFTTLRINSTSTFEAGIGRPNLGVMGFNRQDQPSTYHFAHGFDGTSRAAFCSSVAFFGWASGNASAVSGCDIRLFRDDAGTLAQRNGTNPQTFRIYKTFTDASNYERGFMRWNSNVLQIGTEKAGTGSARDMQLVVDGTARLTVASNGTASINAVTTIQNANNLLINGGSLRFQASNGIDPVHLERDASDILALRRTTNGQTFRLYNTVSGTNNVNFDRVNFRWASNEFIIDAEAGGTGTLRGIKIGSATSSLLGFYGATPVDRPATVADPAGGGTIDTEARTAIGEVIDRLQELGLIA